MLSRPAHRSFNRPFICAPNTHEATFPTRASPTLAPTRAVNANTIRSVQMQHQGISPIGLYKRPSTVHTVVHLEQPATRMPDSNRHRSHSCTARGLDMANDLWNGGQYHVSDRFPRKTSRHTTIACTSAVTKLLAVASAGIDCCIHLVNIGLEGPSSFERLVRRSAVAYQRCRRRGLLRTLANRGGGGRRRRRR